MADRVDLTGDIAETINGAAVRGHALVLGYVDEQGDAAVSFRGSTHVHTPTQLAVWARKPDGGMAKAVSARPRVTLLYYCADGAPGPKYLYLKGNAHVDPSVNDTVYDAMPEGERKQDPERKGVAVLIDVESVNGFGTEGAFLMESARAES
jgi:hypothetical protein